MIIGFIENYSEMSAAVLISLLWQSTGMGNKNSKIQKLRVKFKTDVLCIVAADKLYWKTM